MHYSGRGGLSAESSLFWLFCAFLFWLPLPFGSNRPWALALACFILAGISAIWLMLYLGGRVTLSPRAYHHGKIPFLLLLTISCWVFLQTLPLPPALMQVLSPSGASLHERQGWLPVTLDQAATQTYLLNSIGCCCAFFLVLVLVQTEQRARILLWTLVISGSFQAMYGGLMVLTGVEWGFLVKKYVGLGTATGTFVNRNHLAGYLVMCLAVGTGLLLSRLSSSSITSWRELVRKTLELMLSRKVLLRVFLAIMVIALVLTRSRMGNTAFFVSLAVAGIVAVAMGRKFSPRLVLLLGSIFIIDIWIVGQWFGFDKVVERLEKAAPAAEQRLTVSADTTSILEHYPLTGSGGGSFYSVYTRYQQGGGDRKVYHAHNDYLEIAADLGIPALLLLGAFCLFAVFRSIQLQRPDHSRLQRGVGFALVMVMVWLLLHSAVDFNLQIPANNLTLCVILALAFARLLPAYRGPA